MSELQISPAVFAIVGCIVMVTACVVSSVVFYKKNGNSSENPGSVLSIVFGAPFFLSLCYLLCIIMDKVGASL